MLRRLGSRFLAPPDLAWYRYMDGISIAPLYYYLLIYALLDVYVRIRLGTTASQAYRDP